MSAGVDRWRTSPLGIAAVATGIAAVFGLVVWPWTTAAAGGAVLATAVLLAHIAPRHVTYSSPPDTHTTHVTRRPATPTTTIGHTR